MRPTMKAWRRDVFIKGADGKPYMGQAGLQFCHPSLLPHFPTQH